MATLKIQKNIFIRLLIREKQLMQNRACGSFRQSGDLESLICKLFFTQKNTWQWLVPWVTQIGHTATREEQRDRTMPVVLHK